MRRQASVTQDTDKGITTPVDPALLEVLVCPVTRGPLIYDQAQQELISHQARKAYPIRAGVPIMLVDEARDLDQ
ncbi:MAG: Trm112 family protein [Alphaproteobacteria bacterium]|nr:Trm112 family protein [Alphaproteobacteria bacterium]